MSSIELVDASAQADHVVPAVADGGWARLLVLV